jgi:chemotaxis protein methyltransferase CheR
MFCPPPSWRLLELSVRMTASPVRAKAGMVENGEFMMMPRDFDEIAGVMMSEAGISLNEGKVNLVYSRLAKRLRALGLRDFSEYCSLIASPGGEEERQKMVAALTTNVTRFFREPHHFEHLKNSILPELLAKAKQGHKLRLWSAACSSGQEPYSIALTILNLLPDAPKYDIKILATDIDPNMLAAGEAGIYDQGHMEAVPGAMRSRWFSPLNDGAGQFRVAPELSALVHFRKLNLIGHWPMKGHFQAIFCRNVVIYFDNNTQEKIWTRILPLLAPNGALYIGHSERVTGAPEAALRSDGITIYRSAAKGGVA